MKFVMISPGEVLLEALCDVFWSGHSCHVRGHWGIGNTEVEFKKMEREDIVKEKPELKGPSVLTNGRTDKRIPGPGLQGF